MSLWTREYMYMTLHCIPPTHILGHPYLNDNPSLMGIRFLCTGTNKVFLNFDNASFIHLRSLPYCNTRVPVHVGCTHTSTYA